MGKYDFLPDESQTKPSKYSFLPDEKESKYSFLPDEETKEEGISFGRNVLEGIIKSPPARIVKGGLDILGAGARLISRPVGKFVAERISPKTAERIGQVSRFIQDPLKTTGEAIAKQIPLASRALGIEEITAEEIQKIGRSSVEELITFAGDPLNLFFFGGGAALARLSSAKRAAKIKAVRKQIANQLKSMRKTAQQEKRAQAVINKFLGEELKALPAPKAVKGRKLLLGPSAVEKGTELTPLIKPSGEILKKTREVIKKPVLTPKERQVSPSFGRKGVKKEDISALNIIITAKQRDLLMKAGIDKSTLAQKLTDKKIGEQLRYITTRNMSEKKRIQAIQNLFGKRAEPSTVFGFKGKDIAEAKISPKSVTTGEIASPGFHHGQGIGRKEVPRVLFGDEAVQARAGMEAKQTVDSGFVNQIDEAVKSITQGKGVIEAKSALISARETGKGKIPQAKQKTKDFVYDNLRPEEIMRELDGFKEGALTKNVFNPVYEGYNAGAVAEAKSLKDIQGLLKPLVKDKNYWSKTYEVGKFKGEKAITKDFASFVYAHSKNTKSARHLKGSGLSSDDIKNVSGLLSSEEKAAIDQYLKYNSENMYNRLAPVYEKMTGNKLGKEANYFSINNLEGVAHEEAILLEMQMRANPGIRVEKLNLPDDIKRAWQNSRIGGEQGFTNFSFMDNVTRSWKTQEHYINMAPGIKHAKSFLLHPEIKKAITQRHGKKVYEKDLVEWLDFNSRSAPPEAIDFVNKSARFIRQRFPLAYIGANLSSMAKQAPSLIQGSQLAHELGAGYDAGVRGLAQVMIKRGALNKLIIGKDPFMASRGRVFERELQEFFVGRDARKLFGGKGWNDKAAEIAMQGILTIDRITVNALWKGTYDGIIRKGLGEVEAIKRAAEVVRRTQPVSNAAVLARSMGRGSDVQKLFSVFRNQLNQNANKLFLSHKELLAGEGFVGKAKRTPRWMMRQLMYATVPSMMIGVVKRHRLPTGKELVADMGTQYISGFVIAGNIYDTVTSKFAFQDTSLMETVMKDLAKSFTDPAKAVEFIARAHKLPVTAIKRAFKGTGLFEKLLGKGEFK